MDLNTKAISPRILKNLEAMKTYIVYCDKCGEYGHELPQMSTLLTANGYWWHKGCNGTITISKTTTHEMLENLTFDAKIALHTEIAERIEEINEMHRQHDQSTLQSVRGEIERLNRGVANPFLSTAYWKRSLLNNPAGVPYCPQCDSLLVQPIHTKKRLFSVGLFGVASDTVGKSMECLNCKYKW